jgi:hypothetical protein
MPFQPVTNAGQAAVTMTTWDNQEVVNVFGFSLTVTLTQTVTDSIAGALSPLYDALVPYMFNANHIAQPVVTDLRTEGGPQFTSANVNWPKSGTSGADPLPGQNAALVTWKTATRGKSFRGRSYFGGLTENAITSGVLATGLEGALLTAATTFTGLATFGVISRQHNGALRTNGILTLFNQAVVHSHIATQRRRSFLS